MTLHQIMVMALIYWTVCAISLWLASRILP